MDIQNLIIILFLPILTSLLMLIPSNFVSTPKRRINLLLSLFTSVAGLIVSLYFAACLIKNPLQSFDLDIMFLSAGLLKLHIGAILDNLSCFFLVLIYTVAICTQIFSYAFLKYEEGFTRFSILVNLLIFGAVGLVLSTNLIQSLMFMEFLGVIAGILAVFRYKRPEIKTPVFRAFTLNKIGDIFVLSAVLIFLYFVLRDGDGLIYPLLTLKDVASWGFIAYVQAGAMAYTALMLLLTFGVFAKAAQIPFQGCFQDMSDAPMPACALISTVATAGASVYLLFRLYPLLILSPLTLKVLIFLGILTAVICSIIAFLHNDIKKILIFGGISNLGLIFAALGSGEYSGSAFQLGTYALGQTLLFFAAGVITNKTLTRNVRFLGGLRQYMPTLAIGWIIGSLSISGIFLSGFYSKEMILCHMFDTGQIALLWLFGAAEILTVLYLSRAYFLIFEGNYRGQHDFDMEANEPYDGINPTLAFPCYILTLLTAFSGGFIAPDFQRYIYILRQKFYLVKHPEITVSIFIAAIAAIYLAFLIFGVRKIKLNKIKNLSPAINMLFAKVLTPLLTFTKKLFILQFYSNKIYEFIYKILIKLPARIINWLDKYVINGVWAGIYQLSRFTSYIILRLQNGNINSYIFLNLAFITLVLICVATVYIKGIAQYGG